MSAFPPPEWDVRPLTDMDSMVAGPRDGADHSMQALLAVAPAEGLEGSYKFLLSGSNHLKMRIPIRKIISDKRFEEMYIETQLQLGTQIVIEKNSSCTKWVDILELAQSQDIEVVDKSDKPVTENFITAMQDYQNAHPDKQAGICWRWCLTASRGDVMLLVQALPCALEAIEASNILMGDGAMGIVVACYHLDYER